MDLNIGDIVFGQKTGPSAPEFIYLNGLTLLTEKDSAKLLGQAGSDFRRSVALDRSGRPPDRNLFVWAPREPNGDGGDRHRSMLIKVNYFKFMSKSARSKDVRDKCEAVCEMFRADKARRRSESMGSCGGIDWDANPQFMSVCRDLWELGCPFPKIAKLFSTVCGVRASKGTICGLVRRCGWANEGVVRGVWSVEVEADWMKKSGVAVEQPVLWWLEPQKKSRAAKSLEKPTVSQKNPSLDDIYAGVMEVYAAEEVGRADLEPPDDEDEPKEAGTELVTLSGEVPMTTSLRVAEKFGKKPKHVLRDIDSILKMGPDLDPSFVFVESTYTSKYDRPKRVVEMNEAAFTLLISGWSGAPAMKFKMDFIKEFHRMRDHLRSTAILGAVSSGEMQNMHSAISILGGDVSKIMLLVNSIALQMSDMASSLVEIKSSTLSAVDETPPPKGAMTIKSFCSTQQDVTEDKFRDCLAGGTKYNNGVGLGYIELINSRWVATERGIVSGHVFNAPFEHRSYGQFRDDPYAKLTQKGVEYFSVVIHNSRTGTQPAPSSQGDIFGAIFPFVSSKRDRKTKED
jgi:Rha family phage regulatory protein